MALTAQFAHASPVVITGNDVPHLLGKHINSIVLLDCQGKAIPFQIDEVTADSEYVLDMGELPNISDGNGILDEQDEIVFLWSDASRAAGLPSNASGINANISGGINSKISSADIVTVARGSEKRCIAAVADKSIPRSQKKYINYNHETQRVATPYYYADFAKDRFHFVRAGVMDFSTNKYIDLTNELRVEILLKALFGLIPIRYTEDNIVCVARRYKAGPIRLIRRGDFHLNLGLGVKGSRAAVNQICYPQVVKVPVYVHLPIRFRTLFSQAHIEMTPVIREAGGAFVFAVPSEKLSFPVGGEPIDTLLPPTPLRKVFTMQNGGVGYGWLLDATMAPEHLGGSGFIMRRPPSRGAGAAECGFRLTVRDVPKGSYYITNWVLFSGGRAGDVERLGATVNTATKALNSKQGGF
jgi:hypothetical protein